MNIFTASRQPIRFAAVATMLAAGAFTLPAVANPQSPIEPQLVGVKSQHFESLWSLPNADFRRYTKVMLDPIDVSFRKNWLSLVNETTPDLDRKVTDADVQRALSRARTDANASFAKAFRAAGYEIVTAPGADVLRVTPAVVEVGDGGAGNTFGDPVTQLRIANRAGETRIAIERFGERNGPRPRGRPAEGRLCCTPVRLGR